MERKIIPTLCECSVQFITDYGIVECATLEIINVCILVLNVYVFYRYMNNQCLHSMCDSWYSISCANYLVGGSGSNTYSQSSSRDVRVVRASKSKLSKSASDCRRGICLWLRFYSDLLYTSTDILQLFISLWYATFYNLQSFWDNFENKWSSILWFCYVTCVLLEKPRHFDRPWTQWLFFVDELLMNVHDLNVPLYFSQNYPQEFEYSVISVLFSIQAFINSSAIMNFKYLYYHICIVIFICTKLFFIVFSMYSRIYFFIPFHLFFNLY